MNMPGFTALASLHKANKQYYGVGSHTMQLNSGMAIPQATPRWLLRLLGFCTVDCFPIINCNPDTKVCAVEQTCIENCEDPFAPILI